MSTISAKIIDFWGHYRWLAMFRALKKEEIRTSFFGAGNFADTISGEVTPPPSRLKKKVWGGHENDPDTSYRNELILFGEIK